jgi:hypothetical protein
MRGSNIALKFLILNGSESKSIRPSGRKGGRALRAMGERLQSKTALPKLSTEIFFVLV